MEVWLHTHTAFSRAAGRGPWYLQQRRAPAALRGCLLPVLVPPHSRAADAGTVHVRWQVSFCAECCN